MSDFNSTFLKSCVLWTMARNLQSTICCCRCSLSSLRTIEKIWQKKKTAGHNRNQSVIYSYTPWCYSTSLTTSSAPPHATVVKFTVDWGPESQHIFCCDPDDPVRAERSLFRAGLDWRGRTRRLAGPVRAEECEKAVSAASRTTGLCLGSAGQPGISAWNQWNGLVRCRVGHPLGAGMFV